MTDRRDSIEPPSTEVTRKQFWDAVIFRLGLAVFVGVALGGFFVYVSSGIRADQTRVEKVETLARDYRSPKDAYYLPFLLGFAVGASGSLILGYFLRDSSSKKEVTRRRS